MTDSRRAVVLQYFLLGVAVLVGTYLRLANLRTNPGWYPDEGSDLNVAWNLWQGRFQYFAIGGSMLVNARAPLFPLILVGLFPLFGYDILVARGICALSGIVTIPILFLALQGTFGRWKALGTASMFAVFPLAVLYNRWAFDYNLLMPLFVICFWALLRLIETRQARWIAIAAVSIALSVVTAWLALSLVICLVLVGWFCHRRALVWGIPLAVSLPIVFLIVSYQFSPTALAQDFALTFSRTESSPLAQFALASFNYSAFIASSPWLLPSIAGLLLLEPRRVRVLVWLMFFVLLFFVLRFSMVADLGFYRLLGLVPFLSLGIVALLSRSIPFVVQVIVGDLDRLLARGNLALTSTRTTYVLRLVFVSIFIWLIIADVIFFVVLAQIVSVPTQFPTPVDNIIAIPPADALAVIAYVNANTRPDDVVIASPQIGWAVRARVAEFQQVLSYQGYPTDNYPIPIQPERFVFDPSPANARFAIVDPMWRTWAVRTVPAMAILLETVGQWQVAFQSGAYVVYRNPTR